MKQFKVFLFSLFMCSFCVHSVFAGCAAGEGYGMVESEIPSCTTCPAGWYSSGGTDSCQKCGGGQYSDSAGSSSCSNCAPGTYAPEPTGNDVNVSCTAVNCSAGYGSDPVEGCVKCPAGWYSPGGTSECKKCGAGRYSSSAGSAACTLCQPGTYASTPGADSVNTSCHPCQNGTYQSESGKSTCKTCTGDSTRAFSAPYVSPDKTKCTECPAGNCCYNYGAYICKKGTFAGEGVACQATVTQSVCVNANNNRLESGTGGGDNPGGSGGGQCTPISVPIAGVRKGFCTPCSGGKTTVGQGAISETDDCIIQSASKFVRKISETQSESFSWPDDGSVLEQDITSPNVVFSGSSNPH